MKSWNAVPLTLRVAALGIFAVTMMYLALDVGKPDYHRIVQLSLFGSASWFALHVFALFGSLELARLLAGRASTGAKLATAGWAIAVATSLFQMVSAFDHRSEELYKVGIWTSYAGVVAVGVGMAIAAWRKPVGAASLLVVWLVARRPPPLDTWLYHQLHDHLSLWSAINTAQHMLQCVVLLGFALFAVGALPESFTMPDLRRARVGLAHMSNSLWLRICAVVVVPLATLVLITSTTGGGDKTMAYAVTFGQCVALASLVWFGIGPLEIVRSQHEGVPRAAMLLAAGTSLWSAGLAIQQVPAMYQFMTGDPGHAPWGESTATMFPYLGPLVALTSLIVGSLAIGAFATRRGHLEVGARGPRSAALIAICTIAAFGVMQKMLPEARSTTSALLLMLMALCGSIAALISAAHVARDAMVACEDAAPTIPGAQVV